MRVALAGFGPFPGASFNPSGEVAKALARRRRPALAGLARSAHIFATRYASVDRDLPRLMAQKPDIVLIFGLAGRCREICIETRARNAVSLLFPDAGGRKPVRGIIEAGPQTLCGHAPFVRLVSAARTGKVPARLSRDAGRYLCNYVSWRALQQAPQGRPLVQFVHIPPVTVNRRPRRRIRRRSASLAQLVKAAESVLIALATATRH